MMSSRAQDGADDVGNFFQGNKIKSVALSIYQLFTQKLAIA